MVRYDPSHKSPFPQDLATASSILAGKVGIDNFHAEAAIINYYHAGIASEVTNPRNCSFISLRFLSVWSFG